MTALRDFVLNSSLDDLVAAAERGEIDPDELWQEVLDSLDRSTAILKAMNETNRNGSQSRQGPDLTLRQAQDEVDEMLDRWRTELDAAGILAAEIKTPSQARAV